MTTLEEAERAIEAVNGVLIKEDSGEYEIVNGHHRLHALQMLGTTHITLERIGMKSCLECGVSPGDEFLDYTPSLIGYRNSRGEMDWFCTVCITIWAPRTDWPDESWTLTQDGVRLISAEDAGIDNAEAFYTPA